MAKFSKENKPAGGRGEKDDDKKGGRSSYKAKRSFTRNKGFRENEKSAPRREGGDWKKRERPFSDKKGDDKPFRDRDKKPSYRDRDDRSAREERPERRPAARDGEREKRSGERAERPARRFEKTSDERGERSSRPARSDDRFEKKGSTGSDRSDRKPYRSKEEGFSRRREDSGSLDRRSPKRDRRAAENESDQPRRVKHSDFEEGRSFEKQKTKEKSKPGQANKKESNDGLTRLNKYLANAGLASRREADTLIQSGAVKVNGVVVDQLGYKIKPGDKVTYGDETVKGEKKVYLLLNKPKDYITTVDDPRDRKTVMELIKGACRERVYPVGRLDRNTTGILLFTNDGELTTKLTHPKHGVKKVYHVSLDKTLKTTDFKALVEGIELEDGPAKADDLAFVGEGKREVGIEIHSGRNRIVRRMFEHLGYAVVKLDRVVFAGLTKKDLPRGKHRFLTAKEISFLKMIG